MGSARHHELPARLHERTRASEFTRVSRDRRRVHPRRYARAVATRCTQHPRHWPPIVDTVDAQRRVGSRRESRRRRRECPRRPRRRLFASRRDARDVQRGAIGRLGPQARDAIASRAPRLARQVGGTRLARVPAHSEDWGHDDREFLGALGIHVGYCDKRPKDKVFKLHEKYSGWEKWHCIPKGAVPNSWTLVRNPYTKAESEFLYNDGSYEL